jgi:alpha-methylacyl-CoA racemase
MGPLKGYRIIEIAGIGPGQFCGMLLADMGAELIRIDRLVSNDDLGIDIPPRYNLMNRSRPSVAVDLKHADGVELVLKLCRRADALFEGFRPGVMERLGLGPEQCMRCNPTLVYGRMTGWGQSGPLADVAGHDSNYVALSGALAAIGEQGGPPVLPLNLLGDFGGGGVYLAMGLLAAMLEATKSGQGQVVDAAMVDGAASMMTVFHGLMAGGMWQQQRGSNALDGGAPFDAIYQTSDDQYLAVCAIERRFFGELLKRLGLHDLDPNIQLSPQLWPEYKEKIAEVFRGNTRDHWCALLEGSETCVAPVLTMSEASNHPQAVAREAYVEVDGIVQPAPAPRFSRTPSAIRSAPSAPSQADLKHLADWGLSSEEIEAYQAAGVLG